MQIYENPFLGFRLKVPDDWRLDGWKTCKLSRSLRAMYQVRDDDMPKKMDSSKFIAVAYKYEPGSKIRVECDIETSIFRKPVNHDFFTGLLGNLSGATEYYRSCGIEQKHVGQGDWNLGGQHFQFVDQQNRSKGGTSRYRFVFRQLHPTLWFYAKIAGHSELTFAEALKVFENIQIAETVVESTAELT